ncbi:DUF6314 family protein [uncultured Roseobacter sp.]|uniref:DUF6314 family protein n=1 Tax=uncultured Roseobacter sp. TaxID=114847 RepID=UPI0026082C57|nr:DUF6314 family protein [uncultured Roseobacter sp.]
MRSMPTEVRARVLADFEGTWDLTRQIAHADGTEAHFEGQAVWAPDGQGLRYTETGRLQMAQGVVMQAERRYQWGPDLDVYFEDGRFFHRVPERGGVAEHWCDPDTYKVTYDFTHWPTFTAVWRVAGPKKSYTLHSQYSRR